MNIISKFIYKIEHILKTIYMGNMAQKKEHEKKYGWAARKDMIDRVNKEGVGLIFETARVQRELYEAKEKLRRIECHNCMKRIEK